MPRKKAPAANGAGSEKRRGDSRADGNGPEREKLSIGDTIAKSFLIAVEQRGARTALREKELGIWKSVSWREWGHKSKAIAYALHASDFRPGDVASILSNTKPEWIYADMGVLCAGGVCSGIYPTDAAKQVEYLLVDSDSKVIFVEDDEQLDKVLRCAHVARNCKTIVIDDMEGLPTFSDPMAVSLDDFIARGTDYMKGREGPLAGDAGGTTHRGSGHPGLHVGHHRTTEGCNARQQKRAGADAPCRYAVSRAAR